MVEPVRLSASGVRAFLECRYRYYLDYIHRLAQEEREPVSSFAFGNAMHQAIADFFKAGGREGQTRDDLIASLMRHWDGSVYPDIDTELRRFHQGKRMLEGFYDNPYPEMVERELGVERYLKWKAPRRGIMATGKLDRICLLPDGVIEVLDYKTGHFRLKPAEMEGDLQAIFYRTLAGEAFRGLEPKGIRVTFHYLPSGATVSVEFEREHFLEKWRQVEPVAEQIRKARQKLNEGRPSWAAFPLSRGSRCSSCLMRRHCMSLADGEQEARVEESIP